MEKNSIDTINEFVKNNSKSKLLSKEYKGSHFKLKFKCECGNEFETSFSNFKHSGKRTCNKCSRIKVANEQKLTIEEINKYVDNNSYCELLSRKYINAREKLRFKCKCGNEFETTWINFRNNNKRQCNECGWMINLSKQGFKIKDVIKIVNGLSNCELLSNEYINSEKKLLFKCECGNNFETNLQTFIHYNKRTCDECSKKKNFERLSLDFVEMKKYVENNSDCTFVEILYKKIANRKVPHFKLKCSCGEIFITSKNSFDNYNKKRCDKCSNSQSQDEYFVEKFLKENNIDYIREYKFKNCRYKQILSFDFFLPKYNICIEVDGEFHFKETSLGNDYKNQVKRDNVKNKYCKKNNIKLLRIPYWEFDNNNAENILKGALI